MDLLAEYSDSEGSETSSPEFEIHRLRGTRARMGPLPGAAAFDCAQLKLEEESTFPIPRQSPTTLLLTLLEGLTSWIPEPTLDPPERARKLDSIVYELGRRGFNVESMVHDSWLHAVSFAAVMPAIMTLTLDAVPSSEIAYPEETEWMKLILSDGAPHGPQVNPAEGNDLSIKVSAIKRILTEDMGKVVNWMSHLSIIEMIDGKTPTVDQYRELGEMHISDTPTVHSWMVDRFTVTYLDGWSDASLSREWEYFHARLTPPCNPGQMAARRVSSEDVATEIAERSTGHSMRSGRRSPVLDKYVKAAVHLLGKGERVPAAAIFDAVCMASPLSAEAVNNRGFCTLPDDPSGALKDFDRAVELGGGNALVIAGNRMLALYYLKRGSSALRVADEIWATEAPDGGGFMWNYTATDPELLEIKDLREYVAGLAALIAEGEGEEVLASRWKTRREERTAHGEAS